MSVPAWKQAILNRKKEAEEEAKKKEEKEVSYIASLPPWKRAMVKKQREQSPGSTLERKDSKGKSSKTDASDPPSNKWMAAVQNVKPEVSSSPKLSSRPSWAKPVTSSTFERSANKETAPSSSSNKPAIRPVAKSFSGALSAFSSKPTSPTSSVKPTSTIMQPGTTRVNNKRTFSATVQKARELASTSDTARATSSVISGGVSLRSKEPQPAAAVVSDKRRSFEGDDDEDAKLADMPAWKKALILRRKATASQPNKEPWAQTQPTRDRAATAPQKALQSVRDTATMFQKKAKKEPEKSSRETAKSRPSANTYSPPVQENIVSEETEEVDYPHVKIERHVDLTPVKPSVVANKRPVVKASKENRTSQKSTPKVAVSKIATPASKSPSAKPMTKKKAPSQPPAPKSKHPAEIVNRAPSNGEVSNKLIEQEGSVHRPPVYKVVDEWADVSENDPRFKKLPLWKQALIKRRRSDYTKRSAAPSAPVSNDKTKKSSTTSSTQKTDSKSKNAQNTSKNVFSNKDLSNTNTQNRFQPARKAPPRPTPTPPPSEPEPEEPMFSFSFSKKAGHRTLDAGSESEDSDFDLEDVTVTNLDDLSDEDSGIDKGGIVVMSYKVTNTEYDETDGDQFQQTPSSQEPMHGMTKSDSKSILVDPTSRRKVRVCICTINKPLAIVTHIRQYAPGLEHKSCLRPSTFGQLTPPGCCSYQDE